MKTLLISSLMVLSTSAFGASQPLPFGCDAGDLKTVYDCVSTDPESPFQNAYVCSNGSEYSLQVNQPDSVDEATDYLPATHIARTGATTYQYQDNMLTLSLTVGSRPVRQDGDVVRNAKLNIKLKSEKATVPMTCLSE